MTVPTKHKAAIYDEPGKLSIKIVELDTPKPDRGQVLVELSHSGICHSDYGVMMNNWKSMPAETEAGQVGGHEGIGKVVAVGEKVENLAVGDYVGVKWVASICGACEQCIVGSEAHCPDQTISGFFTPGTFQTHLLADAAYTSKIPDSLSPAETAPLLCGGITVYAALLKSQAKAGDWIVISGAGGGLGHLAVQIATRAMGMRVIGIDSAEKRDLVVTECGAEHFIDVRSFNDDTIGEEVKRLTHDGQGAAAVIVCTASNKAYAQAISMLRFQGRLVCVGMPEGDPVPIAGAFPSFLVKDDISILASATGNRQNMRDLLEFAVRGLVKSKVRLVKLEDLQSVFEEMEQGKLQGRCVIDFSL